MNTPYFIIDKQYLDHQVGLLKRALTDYWPNAIVGYSYKTNSLPWVVSYMKQQGFYAEVVSDDEYFLAKKVIGYESSRIVYNGIAKTQDTFVEAIRNGAIVNIDSQRELLWLESLSDDGKEYGIGIRANFDLESFCPNESACGEEGGRFGFCVENGEFEKALSRILDMPNIRVAGLHLHCSSKTRSLNIYIAIAKMACELKRKYQLNLDYIDIGGGFFGGMDNRPMFPDYIREVGKIMEQSFEKSQTTLIVEPGMSLIGPPIDYVSTVVDVKDTAYNRFVVLDGSRIHIDPLMTKKTYFKDLEFADRNRRSVKKQVISGFTCMEHDRLFELMDAPELSEGDRIVFHKVGAYTVCLSPLFIKYYPDIYLNDNGNLSLVRGKWTEEEYSQKSIITE